MTSTDPARRTLRRRPRWGRGSGRHFGVATLLTISALVAAPALAPPPDTTAHDLAVSIDENAQSFRVPAAAAVAPVARDSYTSTPGIPTYVAGGTNHDWAALVLLFGGFPVTEGNITVITRWMRQENYVDNWWNRNNPLNNGWGSGGGSGLGSYDSLVTAAENAAEALNTHSGYASIVAALRTGADTSTIEAAIWASPWASGHYNNGAHWSTAPVPVITAPADAW